MNNKPKKTDKQDNKIDEATQKNISVAREISRARGLVRFGWETLKFFVVRLIK